jgi:GNAT superfamily N-acetyltransferase
MESPNLPYREIEHDGFKIKVYCTSTEQADIYGLKAKQPLFVEEIFVEKSKRNKGYGSYLLKIIEDFAKDNECDVIFGNIQKDAEFTLDDRVNYFTDIENIKYWLKTKGYSISSDNDFFHKVLKPNKPLRYYGGIGFGKCMEIGNYEVITDTKVEKFKSLSEAKSYYQTIKGEKAIWDNNVNEIIDAWYYY